VTGGEVFGDRRFVARAALALVTANVRYWTGVAPLVRGQLRHWQWRAQSIPDPALRRLALANLASEGFTAEAAALLATLAPSRHRGQAVEAIVALEVMFDYLDGLTELPASDPLGEGHGHFRVFADALDPPFSGSRKSDGDQREDAGYLDELQQTVRSRLALLPATAAVTDVWRRSAARAIEAQVRGHAVSQLGTGQLEDWALGEAAGTALEWREFLAGAAASVLAVHALIVAAADERTTPARAEEIDRLYLSLAALTTMLDTAIDYEDDVRAGRPWLIGHYGSRELLAEHVTSVARAAASHARRLPHGAHHVMTLVGIVAYYTSAASAKGDFARPVTESVLRELRPLSAPTMAMMRAWRLAKRLRALQRGSGADAHGPG
jgi:hypothetical protein